MLIVDGMNVIGSRPDGWWRDRDGAMARLVAALATLGEPVTVVFDSRPRSGEPPQAPGVEVLYATRRGRNAADDEIARIATAGDTVVTSDRDLIARVRANGANTAGPRSLTTRLG